MLDLICLLWFCRYFGASRRACANILKVFFENVIICYGAFKIQKRKLMHGRILPWLLISHVQHVTLASVIATMRCCFVSAQEYQEEALMAESVLLSHFIMKKRGCVLATDSLENFRSSIPYRCDYFFFDLHFVQKYRKMVSSSSSSCCEKFWIFYRHGKKSCMLIL